MYSKETMKRFIKPKFGGELKKPDAVGEIGNLKCGDIMKVYIKVKENKIKDIKFKTYGCVTAIGASDYLCEIAKGMDIKDAEKITSKDVIAKMGDVPKIKVHCSVLAQDALKKAIKNYKSQKNEK
jgi:nitrogen fixation protein NifU and related proteins